jgi:hypothetical protein
MIRMTLTMLSEQFVWRDFDTQELAEQYVSEVSSKGNWGSPQQVINHPEIPEIPAVAITPAVFDVQGNEISPMILGSDAVPAIPASQEIIPGFTVQYSDITVELEEKERVDLQVAKGERSKNICDRALSLIRGYNGTNLTDEQIMEMMTSFSTLNELLRNGWVAKALEIVTAIVPDEVLVSSQMKEDVLNILNGN